ncbi:hypothetical protein F5I97DRAFT_963503 [Phlebopus sp. FC_14]|nr:hypothetical protein F5I97DRAFT_963503 [Phlebopus sp. FC_14]
MAPSDTDAKPVEQTHPVSVGSMVILALCLTLMAALAIGVALRHRAAVKARRRKTIQTQEPAPTPAFWSLCRARHKKRGSVTPQDSTTIVGALHTTTVLVAAAPTKIFASPAAMHFKLPADDKFVLILGMPCVPVLCELHVSANFPTYPNHVRLGGPPNCVYAAPLVFAPSMYTAPQDSWKESYCNQPYHAYHRMSTTSAQTYAGSPSYRR